jgi:chloramphenicol 3-O-phosphotransferase
VKMQFGLGEGENEVRAFRLALVGIRCHSSTMLARQQKPRIEKEPGETGPSVQEI